jgi:hypothetical protein
MPIASIQDGSTGMGGGADRVIFPSLEAAADALCVARYLDQPSPSNVYWYFAVWGGGCLLYKVLWHCWHQVHANRCAHHLSERAHALSPGLKTTHNPLETN